MPYCPACRTEYENDVAACTDCGAALVEELPPEPAWDWDDTDWVTVEELGDEVTASIIEGYLAEHEIEVRLLSHHDRELATTIGALSTVEVQVPADQLDDAIALLDERDSEVGATTGSRADEDDDDEDDDEDELGDDYDDGDGDGDGYDDGYDDYGDDGDGDDDRDD